MAFFKASDWNNPNFSLNPNTNFGLKNPNTSQSGKMIIKAIVEKIPYKTNIKALPDKLGLAFIKKLKPIAYNWDHRSAYVRECGFQYGTKDGTLASEKEHYGIIAQDLKSVLDEINVRFDALGHDNEKDAYRVTYEELIAPIIKSIQEQQEQIEALQTEVEKLKNR